MRGGGHCRCSLPPTAAHLHLRRALQHHQLFLQLAAALRIRSLQRARAVVRVAQVGKGRHARRQRLLRAVRHHLQRRVFVPQRVQLHGLALDLGLGLRGTIRIPLGTRVKRVRQCRYGRVAAGESPAPRH
jgi:hypothetical protein